MKVSVVKSCPTFQVVSVAGYLHAGRRPVVMQIGLFKPSGRVALDSCYLKGDDFTIKKLRLLRVVLLHFLHSLMV